MLTKLLRSVGSSYKGQWRKKWIVDSVSIITAVTYETKYSRVDQVKFVEDSLQKGCLFKAVFQGCLFQGCLSQFFLGTLLNTLSHIGLSASWKLCLNLCSRRWLSPYRTSAIYLIKIGLWQSKKRIKRRPYGF